MEVCLIKLLFTRIVWCDCLWKKRSSIQPLSQVKCQRQRIKGKAVLHTTSPSRLRRASSPSRGALGKAMQFVLLTAAAWHTTRTKRSGTPEAPLLGELSNEVRLRGCTKGSLTVSRQRACPLRHCFAMTPPPLGELSPKVTERARTPTESFLRLFAQKTA